MSSREATKRFVHDGDSIFFGGFGNLYPFSLAHEVIRQKKRDMTLVKHSPELIADQMIGAGCVKKLVFSWLGNPGIGSSHAFRRAVEQDIPNALELEEYTHASVTGMLKAGAVGIPFLPAKALLGSDYPRYHPRIKFMDSPYTGEKVCLLPALTPDVALIHVQRTDAEGNAQAWGILSDIRDGAFASKRIIVSAEEVVSTEVIRRDPNRTLVPGFMVAAVVHEPWGAHPSSAQGYYDRDNDYYIAYERETRSLQGFQRFLDEWIFGVKSRKEYVSKLGKKKVRALKPRSYKSLPVDYGLYK
jgi:glutaconate CoA-transferase subunit A